MSHRITEQIRMMEELLQLQSVIRAKKEKQRTLKTSNSKKYETMLEPITTRLTKLTPPIVRDEGIKKKEDHDNMEFSDSVTADLKEEEEEEEEEDSDIYYAVLRSVYETNRDDGVFGLNVDDNSIGDYRYRVRNNTLEVYDDDHVVRYPIKDNINLWRLLLTKRPNGMQLRVKSGGKYMQFVEDYKKIVDDLDLVNVALKNYGGSSVTKRSKYKLIKNIEGKKGSGFMFSVHPPPFAANKHMKPSTIFIPSDKKGLLRALVKAVAELRAGNTSMQNLVVPLAQEAKRRKILPRHLLSADEKTWVFS